MAPKRNVEQQQGPDDEGKRVRPRRTYTADPVFTRTTRSKTSEVAVNAENKSKKQEAVTKKPKGKAKAEAVEEEEDKLNGVQDGEEEKTVKTLVVEHCKQCSSFKKTALRFKEGLEIAVPGTTVTLNPDKPRRGCFEIREDGGETFISLLDMKRPFKPMKDLDMEKVISDIADKIRN